jgi:histone-arginine methyltransferase CARM1
MTSDFLTRPSFGKVHLANVSETENGVQYVVDPKQEYEVYITSDDKFVKLQRVPDGENLLLSLADYRVVPLKSKMVLFFVTNVFEYRQEKAFGMSLGINFLTDDEAKQFCKSIQMAITLNNKAPTTKAITSSDTSTPASDFNSRTEENSATQYFQFYSWLSQQQNMMQDFVRTSTYQKAMHMNPSDFQDKVILDVGAGSGVLSFFAVQAGAKKVYAVEASQMAAHCAELVRTNNLSDKITVIPGKIEEIQLPEKVDVIISEPMGYMLVNERMLESYMYGRKFLKPGGRMFPTTGDLYFALFNDDALFMEHNQKYSFWASTNFLGIDLSALKGAAYQEIFKQPIVDTWHPSTLISDFGQWTINFEKDAIEKLHVIDVEYELTSKRTAFCHGVATWFDVSFLGTDHQTYLSTAPNAPLTHWYQVRCPIMSPVLVRVNDKVRIRMKMVANERQSYDITMSVTINGHSQTAEYDLKNPSFRYNGVAVAPAAGLENGSATQQLANTVYSDQDGNAVSYPQDQNYVYVDGTEQQQQQYQDYSQAALPQQVNGFINNPTLALNALLSNHTSPLTNNICPSQQAQPSISTSPFRNGV